MKLIEKTIKKIKPIDAKIMEEAQARLDGLTKPKGSLGRLEEFAKRIVGITLNLKPTFDRKVIFTMAGDHGVACEGVSLFPQEVTCQMVANFINGGAGINVLARHVGAEVIVVDMGVAKEILEITNSPEKSKGFPVPRDLENLRDQIPEIAKRFQGRLNPRNFYEIPEGKFQNKKINFGTKNMAKGPAMTQEEAIKSIEAGIEVFEEEFNKGAIDIAGTGDMGIANTTPSSAIVAAITGASCKEVTGRGTGLGDEQLELKIKVIEKALMLNKPDPKDPLDILSKVGGYEIGGICGLVLAAASRSVPVVMDGFISSTGTLLAYTLAPIVKDYVFAAHMSQEKGHKAVLEHIGLKPVLDLDMRLGEGTGAALAIGVIEAGVKILNEMATFGQAGVSEESEKRKNKE